MRNIFSVVGKLLSSTSRSASSKIRKRQRLSVNVPFSSISNIRPGVPMNQTKVTPKVWVIIRSVAEPRLSWRGEGCHDKRVRAKPN